MNWSLIIAAIQEMVGKSGLPKALVSFINSVLTLVLDGDETLPAFESFAQFQSGIAETIRKKSERYSPLIRRVMLQTANLFEKNAAALWNSLYKKGKVAVELNLDDHKPHKPFDFKQFETVWNSNA